MATPKFDGYSFSWTQPYQSLNEFFPGQYCKEIYERLKTDEQIDRLDKLDVSGDSMLTYTDAEARLKKIRQTK